MKKKLLIILIIPILCFSQERKDEVRPKLSVPSGKLTNIIGWEFYTHSGKWINQKNIANSSTCYALTIRNINYNNELFYILTISEKKGAWEYPAIKKGWHDWNSYRSYIFDKNEFEKIKQNTKAVSNHIEISTLDGFDNKIDISYLNDSVYNALNYGIRDDLNYTFQIQKEKNQVRFILPFQKGYEFLDEYWGFGKCYFECSLTDFNLLTK